MASKEQMCSYSDLRGCVIGENLYGTTPEELLSKPNKRIRCPACGRRMWAARRTCSDGCCLFYCVPPHKVKGWWKLGKRKKTSRDLPGRL